MAPANRRPATKLAPCPRWKLLEASLPMLRAYIARYVRSGETASDVLQEVSLQILLSSGPDDDERFAAWSRGVARYVILGQRRRNRLVATHLDGSADELDSDASPDPERQANFRRSLARVSGEVDRDSFDLLVRRYVLEETCSELAHDLVQSPAAVRMRLMRLRCQLRPGVAN
jgi:RNA polymerase sigma factor (sigma-70 family)